MRNPKNFAIKATNFFQSQQIIAYMKNLGIDVRNNRGLKRYKNIYYCVDNGEFGLKKSLVDFPYIENCDFATEIPVKLFVEDEMTVLKTRWNKNEYEQGCLQGKAVRKQKFPCQMYVSNHANEKGIKQTVISEQRIKEMNRSLFITVCDGEPMAWLYAKALPKLVVVTLEDIAKRFKCDVSQLRIKK